MTIDWDWLKDNIPDIAERLADMMVQDALSVASDEGQLGVVMMPSVAITYQPRDPTKKSFTVKLSVEIDDQKNNPDYPEA